MQVFQPAITQSQPKNFNSEASKQIWELSLSIDLSSLLQAIKAGQDCGHVYCIHGEPGSGCTTLVQGLCQCLCESNIIKESEILYLSLNQGSSEPLLWDFMSTLAKERNDQEKATLFTQLSSRKVDEKRKALCEFLQHSFKVVCIDNADHWVDSLINNVLKACNIISFIVYNEVEDQVHNEMTCDLISSISVHGLMECSVKALVSKQLLQSNYHALTDEEISNLCDLVNCNPFAMELFCGVLSSPDSNDGKAFVDILQKSNFTEFYKEQTVGKCALDRVLELIIGKVIKVSSVGLLYKLCSLRQPLPLLNIIPEVEELLQLNLLSVKHEGNVKCIYLHPTLKKYLSYKRNFYSDGDTANFDILCCWISLVSEQELQNLIKGAEENAWPFVPEKWQFIKDVGKKETLNVKELILAKNATISSLTELQILQECLYHSYVQNNFQKLAAIIYVLDRFLFWQGGTKISMEIVDYIQKNSPETAIAPQLLVRRARFMKHEGNFRGADEILDEVSKERHGVGQWRYKEDYQFQLVKAACIQLKGEIQYSLGNWVNSASLFLESIRLFETLPNPDKKGIALGYGLLCPCLRNMTVKDYMGLSFGLLQCHPLLAAYISAQEAANSESSIYTPMFFVRHICHAGEVMLQFIKLSTLSEENQQLLRVAIEDLKDSIQAHQTYKSLTSREQFYIFVLASYKLSEALLQLKSNEDQETGHTLKAISVKLYEHYCSSSGHVLIDDHVTGLINKCLDLLGLDKFQKDDLPNAGQALSEYYKRRYNERLRQNTRLAVVGLFANSQSISSVPKSMYGSRDTTLSRIQEQQHHSDAMNLYDKSSLRLDGKKTVDRCAVTAEQQQDETTPEAHQVDPRNGKTVDRCAVTEAAEKEETTPEAQQVDPRNGKTVDRCAVTKAEKEETTPEAHHVDLRNGKTVDRCAVTKAEKEETTPEAHQVDPRNGKTVDRCIAAIDKNSVTEKRYLNVLHEQESYKTVDEYAFLISRTVENQSGVIVQSLEDEVVSLPLQTQEISVDGRRGDNYYTKASAGTRKMARDAILWKYDYTSRQWRDQPTMVYIGDPLQLKKGMEGAQRDVFTAEFINQDEPLGRYVAKQYRKKVHPQQYEYDVLSQMTARQYVTWFNQTLSQAAAGAAVGEIQFIPVVLLQLVDLSGHVTEVFNAEPYMSGEFTKLTNNVDWKNEKRRTDLVLAYSHFTYQASLGKLMIVDIQGWAPHDNKGCTFLTDPQIHSTVYKCFGTGNFKGKGYENFWRMHSECNEICKMLKLVRPISSRGLAM